MTKQTAGDRSILVNAGGAVTVANGLTMSEVQDLVRLMLRENLVGIQAEAHRVAEERNEKLLSDFLRRAEEYFGAALEEKLGGLRDPGAQFALRHAQLEYCKYGSEAGESDSIELLISRLEDGFSSNENVVIDEAIKLCGRLSSRQMDLTCLLYMVHRTRFNGIGSDAALAEFLSAAARYADGVNCSSAELAMLDHSGVVQQFTQTKHWLPLSQVLKNHYPGVFLRPESREYFELSGNLLRPVLSVHIRDKDKFQPCHVSLDRWEDILRDAGLGVDDVKKLRAKADALLLSDEEVIDITIRHAPAFTTIVPALEYKSPGEPPELCNYDLAPIGRALALARTRRDGWRPDTDLASLLRY